MMISAAIVPIMDASAYQYRNNYGTYNNNNQYYNSGTNYDGFGNQAVGGGIQSNQNNGDGANSIVGGNP